MGSEGQIVEEERDSVQAEMVSHIRSQEREIVEGESQIVGIREEKKTLLTQRENEREKI